MKHLWSVYEYHFSCNGLNFTKVNLIGIFDNYLLAKETLDVKKKEALQRFKHSTIIEEEKQCTINGEDMLYQLFIVESNLNQQVSIEIIDEE